MNNWDVKLNIVDYAEDTTLSYLALSASKLL